MTPRSMTPRTTTTRLATTVAVLAVTVAGCGAEDRSEVTGATPAGLDGERDAEASFDESVVLMVAGTISPDPPVIEFSPTRLLPTAKRLDVPPGPWTLALEGDGWAVEVAFDVIDQIDGDAPSARFSVPVQPAPVGPIERMSVSYDGELIGAADGRDAVPSIDVSTPAVGATVPIDELEIGWESDSATSAAAYLSLDGGDSWTSVVTQTTDSPVRPAPGIAAPSTDTFVIVTVSDGVNASYARVGPFTLTSSG